MRQLPFFLTAAASLLCGEAQAADYDYNPPLVEEAAFPEMEEYVPVETKTQWYIRGDLGVDITNIPETFNNGGAYNSIGSLSGSVAAGYQFNDLFRMEGELGYTGLGDFDSDPTAAFCPGTDTAVPAATTVPCFVERDGGSHAWTFLVNGFFDFGTFARITPYVGAGAGIAYTDYGVYTETECTDSGTYSCTFPGTLYSDVREREFHFAYQLSAGASYDLTDKLKLDLGYRLFGIPGAKQVVRDGDGVKFEDSTLQHQIRVGLRLGL
ncbi:outer membrane protein [Notoacmeibacter sp. MSK16QG-6]|uniref:outer membrane protein n=1 Tax=Notoacmeibacter sp. MSK16QG-6 TaxID=2957982 RepID=UPI00209CD25B|nr:outer membrane beta-barrel protein [Notoacmeibacter sp. MSK16QG-6]MCP1200107.1 outer membrane beta-barrel protein [Notoacmeibacter sp. MSK16QG-6]